MWRVLVNQIAQTSVRNIAGQFSLDDILSQTLKINAQIKTVIDKQTEEWVEAGWYCRDQGHPAP